MIQTSVQTSSMPKGRLAAGYLLSGLTSLFLLMDGVMKLFKPAPVIEATTRLGYSESVIVGLGLVLLVCTALYIVPRTSLLGAILLTGYLGGATATHVRVGQPFLFPVIFGILVWAGIYLRDDRLRSLIPFRHQESRLPDRLSIQG